MRLTREELIEGIITQDFGTSFNRVSGGVRGEKETRYHSLSVLDKLKNKPEYAGKITPEVRGVSTDGSKDWLQSMAGAKTVSTNSQYGNYGQQADYTPFMQLSRSTATRP
jgi:hypothetical protein